MRPYGLGLVLNDLIVPYAALELGLKDLISSCAFFGSLWDFKGPYASL